MVDHTEANRIRWRSRRGLLELDLILTRFLERYLSKLSQEEVMVYSELLNYADNDLLDLVNGKMASEDPTIRKIMHYMHSC